MTPHWEHFSHEADMGVRGYGDTEAQAFEQAALAMTAIVTEPERIALREHITVEVQAPDRELLLAEWLNRVIYEMATRRMLFGRFEVNIVSDRLRAELRGERLDVERHRPAVEIKGATYTDLAVTERGGVWIAQTVVDV